MLARSSDRIANGPVQLCTPPIRETRVISCSGVGLRFEEATDMCNSIGGVGSNNLLSPLSGYGLGQPNLSGGVGGLNPLDALQQVLNGASQGMPLNPAMLRQIIRQLDTSIVQSLLSGGQIPQGPQGAMSSTQQPCGMPDLSQLAGCFPQNALQNCFPSAMPQQICAPQPPCAPPPAAVPPAAAPPPPQPSKIKKGKEWNQGMVDASGQAIPAPPKQGSNAHFDKGGNFQKWTSPLTLDMNGDGKVSSTTAANGKQIDIDGDGKVDQSAWAGQGDGVLAFDRDGDGVAGKDGKELFGDATDLGDGKKYANGFDALKSAALKKLGPGAVADGVLNAQELAALERPVAQGGIGLTIMVDGKQVRPSESGISQINLGYTEAGANGDESGNQHRQVGAGFVRNGQKGKMDDVWFQHS